MKLLDALRNATKRLAADLEDSKLFTHSGDKGEFREQIIQKFLRPFLPPCYGIGSGQIFSSDGAASDQADVVLYDAVFSNVLFRNEPNSLSPCESVYGLIEVKSVLNTLELESAITNVASVKRLQRASSSMLNITPTSSLEISGDIRFSQTHTSNPYLGVVFGYDGLVPETACKILTDRIVADPTHNELLPNCVFLYKRGATILRILRHSAAEWRIAPPGQPFNGFAITRTNDDTLSLFFLTLNTILNNTRLRSPDFTSYWRSVFYAAANAENKLFP